MIGAALSRNGSVRELKNTLPASVRTIVTPDESFLAWSGGGCPHAYLSSRSGMSVDTDTTIVCGVFGEIFADDRLRQKLARIVDGQPPPDSPADLLALAYRHYGSDAFADAEGEFAAFIFDQARGLLLSRTDRIGVQRFYYSHNQQSHFICTDLHSLLRLARPANVRKDAVLEYFFLGFVPAPNTIYEDVEKTTPGFGRSLRRNTWRLDDLVQPPADVDQFVSLPGNAGIGDAEDSILAELERSVARRLNGSDSATVMLSSGYDSSLCAALLKSQCETVDAYTIGFEGRAANENDNAREIARHLGLRHHDLVFSTDDFLDGLTAWVQAHAEPWSHPNGLSTYLAIARIMEQGAPPCVFDGSGGDYLFRDWGPKARRIDLARKVPGMPWVLHRALRYVEDQLPDGRVRKALQDLHQASINDAASGLIFYQFWKSSGLHGKLTGENFELYESTHGRAYMSGGKSAEERYLAYYRSWGFDASVGRSVMEANLQGARTTFPYEDAALVALVTGMPRHLRFPSGSTRSLQEGISLRFIPATCFASRKKAMETPLELVLNSDRGFQLLKNYLSRRRDAGGNHYDVGFVEKILNEFKGGKKAHAQRLWNILVYEVWDESREF